MRSETLIVTASDGRYFPFLRDLLRSLGDKPELSGIPVGILDLGLSGEEAEWVDARARRVVPECDLDFPGRKKAATAYQAHVARAFLPRHFPGYQTYLWMDADAWLQRGEAVRVLIDSAADGSLAICPEADVGYGALYDGVLQRFLKKTYRRSFGRRKGRALLGAPPVNSGVFALRGDAPHWAVWQKALSGVLRRVRDPYTDQTSLTAAVYTVELPVRFLPATFNWACGLGLPAVGARGDLAHPCPPHEPLHVVHLTGPTKWREHVLATVGGAPQERSLRYRGGNP